MSTGSGRVRRRCCRALVAAAALSLLLLPSSAATQEVTETGWLGLGLEEHLQCRMGSDPGRGACERHLVITQVVVGGPADRAGVQPGDTLLAVSGRSMAAPERREAVLTALRPGRPVRLALGRASGRVELQVLPSRRPDRVERVRGAEGPLVSGAPLPLPRAGPRARGEDRQVVEVRTDGGQVVLIRRAPGAAVSVSGEGTPLTVPDAAQLDRQLRISSERMAEAVERRLEVEKELLRWVELQLGPELQALQDSVFRQAREQLDSLRKVHARQLAARAAAEARAAPPSPPAPVDRPKSLPVNERRLAGAEFESLGPELAEFFEVERGLLVLRVLPGTPADRIGLRPGDVVVEAGGAEVRELSDLRRVLVDEAGPRLLRWNRKGRLLTGTIRE